MGQGRRTVSAEDSVTVQCMGGVALSCAKPRLPWVPRLVVCPCMGTAPRVAKVGGRCGDGHSANACKGGGPNVYQFGRTIWEGVSRENLLGLPLWRYYHPGF